MLALINEVNTQGGENRDYYLGIIYHNLSRIDPEKYVQKALNHLDQAHNNTKDPLALGYYGSAVTLEGNLYEKKKKVMTAAAKVEEGFKIIDSAVNLDPDNFILRFLRLSNAIGVGEASPFKRYDIAREDLNFLEKEYASFNSETKANYHLCLGQVDFAEDRIEEAIYQFEKAIQAAPKSAYARIAMTYLEELEE